MCYNSAIATTNLENDMSVREELKARMIAHLGMDAETGAWIAETIRMLSHVDREQELEFFRNLQK